MKNVIFSLHTFPWLFALAFIASCSGQSSSKVVESNQAVALIPDAQIDDYVVNIFEDSGGNLWFGTMAKGVACYDGKTLRYLTDKDGLCENTVVNVAEDQAGNLWFGSHNGASRFDGKTMTKFGAAEGLLGAGCHILADRNGTIWAGTNHGVFRFNGFNFIKFDLPNPAMDSLSYKWEAGKIWSFMEDSKGNIWFARDGYGACKYDGTSFTFFTQKDGLCSNNVSRIVEDKKGIIWFSCISSDTPKQVNHGGVCRYDGHTITRFPEIPGLSQNDSYALYADKKGDIWMGANGVGVYRYDGKSFHLYKETDRMDLTHGFGVQCILEDKKGTLWFGFSGGLFRLKDSSIVNVTQGGPWP